MFATACLFVGLMAAAEPTSGLPTAPPEPDTLTVTIAAVPTTWPQQQKLLNLINTERSMAGLKVLEWDERLAEAARDHAEMMSREGRLSHQFEGEPDLLHRLNQHSIRLDAASENVVYDVTPEGANEAFTKSPHHLENMLNATYDGVGIAIIDVHGILYVVEDFAHRIADMTDEAAAQHVAARFANLRQQSGLTPLGIVVNARLEGLIDQMVLREAPDSHAPLSIPGARFAASYATANIDEIPATVERAAALRGVNACTIGVRFARTARYPSGLYWVSIVMLDQNAALASK